MVPEDQSITFAKGKQNDVDILVGSNHDEGTFFNGGNVTAEQAKTNAQRTYGDLAGDFLKLYPAGSDAEASASGLARSRDEVGWHMRTWAELQVKNGPQGVRVLLHARAARRGRARGFAYDGACVHVR